MIPDITARVAAELAHLHILSRELPEGGLRPDLRPFAVMDTRRLRALSEHETEAEAREALERLAMTRAGGR